MTTDYSEFTAMGSDWDDIAAEAIGQERIVVNMGPQHPSTHGVLRMILELDGETVTEARRGKKVAVERKFMPGYVLAKLAMYREMGIEAFILSGYPHAAEADLFARHVLPRIDHAPLER